MLLRSKRLLAVVVCAAVCAAVGAAARPPSAGYTLTEDHNGDGRPDVWRVYDTQHRLSEVSVDTNFDGRSDVHEYYEHGALVRRESDRDFNDRVDLVEEFDAATREHVRSVVDVDYDGTADLLVLFRDGAPVFTKWATRAVDVAPHAARQDQTGARRADDDLVSLEDPFQSDLAFRAVRVARTAEDVVGLSTSGGLPASALELAQPLAPSAQPVVSRFPSLSSHSIAPYSPRGPPPAFAIS